MQNVVVIITGATKGIGRLLADALAADGFSLGLCSRSEADAGDVAESIGRDFGVATVGMQVDVAQSDDVRRFADLTGRSLGPARIVINNAGILGPVGDLDALCDSAWDEVVKTNLLGAAHLIASYYPQLKAVGQGRVINLSGGGVGGPHLLQRTSAYTTSKFAIAGLTESLAAEFEQIGATINSVAPGAMPTGFMRGVLDVGPEVAGAELFEEVLERETQEIGTSLDRFLSLTRYLISSEAQHINGRTLSARWETPDSLRARAEELENPSLFRLRRIDEELYGAR